MSETNENQIIEVNEEQTINTEMESKDKVKIIISIIMDALLIAMFVILLIAIWGDIVYVSLYSNNYNYYASVGVSYYLNSSWKIISDMISKAGTLNRNAYSVTLYVSLITNILAFVVALVVIYTFAIKGIVKGVKALTQKRCASLAKEATICAGTFYLYVAFTECCTKNIFSTSYVSTEWGAGLAGVFTWPIMIILAAYLVYMSFDKNNLTKFVSAILRVVCCFGLIGIAFNALNNCYTINGEAEGLLTGLCSYLIHHSSNVPVANLALLGSSTIFISFVIISSSFNFILCSNDLVTQSKSTKSSIVFSALLLIVSVISMILATPTITECYGSATTNGASDYLVSVVVWSAIILGISITNYILTNEKK